jgi:hypothetical protein
MLWLYLQSYPKLKKLAFLFAYTVPLLQNAHLRRYFKITGIFAEKVPHLHLFEITFKVYFGTQVS